MNLKVYIGALTTIAMSVMFIPSWDELIKIYVVSVVALVTAIINVLFKIGTLREYVVNRLVASAIQEIFKDHDVQKLMKELKRSEKQGDG